jgi:hypothetical protein
MRRFAVLLAALGLAAGACDGDSSVADSGPLDGPALTEASTPDKGGGDGSIYLAPGELRDFTDKAGVVEGTLPTRGNETFILLLMSLDTTPLRAHAYTTASVTTTSGELTPEGAGEGGGDKKQRRPGRKRAIDPFQRDLRRIIDSRPRRLWVPKRHYASTQPPRKGDTRTFNVGGATITAEAVLVDDVAAYWLDKTTAPLATIDPQILKELAQGFGETVVPRERIYFGQESDVDGDGHISVLFTPLVTQSGPIAYFSPCDLVDPKVVTVCADSNEAELLYARPTADLPDYMATAGALLELFAHELQHAIYFHRKYILNNASFADNENPYITEGCSDLAADLVGYNGGLIHRFKAGLDGVDLLSLPNLTTGKITKYVPEPEDGVMRGGINLLIRYLFDQAGGDAIDGAGKPVDKGGIKWLRAFVDSPELNDENVTKSSGLTLEQLIKQFWTALALSNRGPDHGPLNPDPRYNFLPTAVDPVTGYTRGLNLYGSYKSTKMMGPRIQSFDSPDGSLRSGGAELLQLRAKSTVLRFVVKAKAEARPMVRVIRTQ